MAPKEDLEDLVGDMPLSHYLDERFSPLGKVLPQENAILRASHFGRPSRIEYSINRLSQTGNVNDTQWTMLELAAPMVPQASRRRVEHLLKKMENPHDEFPR